MLLWQIPRRKEFWEEKRTVHNFRKVTGRTQTLSHTISIVKNEERINTHLFFLYIYLLSQSSGLFASWMVWPTKNCVFPHNLTNKKTPKGHDFRQVHPEISSHTSLGCIKSTELAIVRVVPLRHQWQSWLLCLHYSWQCSHVGDNAFLSQKPR